MPWIFLILLNLLFALASVEARMVDRVIAVVGDQPILHSDVLRMQKELKKSPALQNIYSLGKEADPYKEILNRMIEEKVIHLSVQSLGATVDDTDVEKQIQSIASQNGMKRDQLLRNLKNEGISFETYKKNIRAQLERRNLFERELRGNSRNISDDELLEFYRKNLKEEIQLKMLSSKSRSQLVSVKKQLSGPNQGQVMKDLNPLDLGWNSVDSLHPTLASAIKKENPKKVVGPVLFEGEHHLLFIADKRRGSDKDFNSKKDQIRQAIQSQEFEQRFEDWLKNKKKNMNIVMNG